jgi:chemotaxis protein histidine kinase CheA
VRLIDGKIAIDSQPGRGTMISVKVPWETVSLPERGSECNE